MIVFFPTNLDSNHGGQHLSPMHGTLKLLLKTNHLSWAGLVFWPLHFYFWHDTDLWHCILAAILVAHATMKYSNVAWKSRFLRTFMQRWSTFVVFLPSGTFLNLPTRLNGLAEHRVLLDHPLLFEMFRIKKLIVRKGEKMETTMINGGRWWIHYASMRRQG